MRKFRYFLGGRLFPCALTAALSVLAICAFAVWLPRVLAPLALAERLFSFAAVLFVACSSELPECKLPKTALIVLLPWTGAVLSFFWRRKKPPVRNTADTDCAERIPALSERICGLHAGKAESIAYFSVGREMYNRLLTDLAAAEKYIWLQYYIVAHGAFFHAVSEILEQKAAAGLDVRLLYDDFGCSLTLPKRTERELAKRGIKAYALRRIGFPSRALNRRNHRKIAVIDGQIAYTGGINLADEYIGEKIRFGHWKDTAVRVTGSPALQFARLIARELDVQPPHTQERTGTIPCAVIADGAEDSLFRAGECALCAMINGCGDRVYLNTPYLAPDEAVSFALRGAALAGKDVRIMIPHIPDKRTAFLITRSYARELEKSGVRIREYTAGFLHAKSVVSDGRFCFVSSYNLDFRSLYFQAECGLYAESEMLAETLEQDFLSAWETGTALQKAGFFTRCFGALLRLFAPLI